MGPTAGLDGRKISSPPGILSRTKDVSTLYICIYIYTHTHTHTKYIHTHTHTHRIQGSKPRRGRDFSAYKSTQIASGPSTLLLPEHRSAFHGGKVAEA